MSELESIGLPFTLAGSGTYEPRTAITSDALDAREGRPAGSSAALGIAERRYAEADETSSMMGAEAAQRAIADAGWSPHDLDALIGACGVMEQPIPGTAPLVQRRLGLGESGIPAIDINATCLSFLPALDHALTGMALGRWQRVVIFAADIASAALDHSNPEISAIFGDGAAAVALEAHGPSRLLASRFETYGAHADICRLEAGGTRLRPHEDLEGFLAHSRFRMEGLALFRATAKRFPGFLSRLLQEQAQQPTSSLPSYRIRHPRRQSNISLMRWAATAAELLTASPCWGTASQPACRTRSILHGVAVGFSPARRRCLSARRPESRSAGQ